MNRTHRHNAFFSVFNNNNNNNHVTIVMVLQMANLAENCDVTMVLVLQMVNIGGQLNFKQPFME